MAPLLVLNLPSGTQFLLLSTLHRKVKQTGSSENVGFNYWSKGVFPFLFDLYSLVCSSLNNISLPQGVINSCMRQAENGADLAHSISLDWMNDLLVEWMPSWFCGCLINWRALWLLCLLFGWMKFWRMVWLAGWIKWLVSVWLDDWLVD